MLPNRHQPRRVVVTGMGLISPVGLNVSTAWKNVVAGQSGIGPITLFPTDNLRVKIAGEAWGFNPTDFMSSKDARRADRNVQFALAAAKEALAQAKLYYPFEGPSADQAGVLIGSGAAAIWTYTAQVGILEKQGPQRVSPLLIPMMVVDSASVQVSILAGAHGPNFGLASACSTGADAIGESLEMIRRGEADLMITGGTEAGVTPIGVVGFDQMGALSRRNHEPQKASRPFDAERDGFVLSEGAGVLILEALEHAEARGAQPLAEVLAYANTTDATHLTSPDESAVQAARAISRVLQKAGLEPAEVDYINAHGTSTPQGDPFEVRAIRRALGAEAARVPVSSTKSVTGHLLGAAGAVEAIWCIMALREGVIPPTINYRTPDPQCDLDCVPNAARQANLRVVLSDSFGFGGHNSILAFKAIRNL
jgi:beta-ketoacyl-acyl-carrier-protein synthase II